MSWKIENVRKLEFFLNLPKEQNQCGEKCWKFHTRYWWEDTKNVLCWEISVRNQNFFRIMLVSLASPRFTISTLIFSHKRVRVGRLRMWGNLKFLKILERAKSEWWEVVGSSIADTDVIILKMFCAEKSVRNQNLVRMLFVSLTSPRFTISALSFSHKRGNVELEDWKCGEIVNFLKICWKSKIGAVRSVGSSIPDTDEMIPKMFCAETSLLQIKFHKTCFSNFFPDLTL